jgi:hypothetical protein
MWYTRLAYRPALHRLLQQKQKAVPFADIDEENENTPDEPETPGDVATPTPQVPELIPDLTVDIGVAPVDTPEPEPQSVKEVPNIIARPQLPSHPGCRCDRRLTIVPSNKPYQLVRWDADSACPICQQQAKVFNEQMQRAYQMLNSNE